MKQYADWKAPRTDEEHLIWPNGAQIVEDARANSVLLSGLDRALIQNTPIKDLRCRMRKSVGLCDKPLIATGHQIEMYHPGVWVKNILIDQAAKKVGGRAMHIAVDTDSPKHLQLRWPGHSHLMSDDAAILDGAWSGLVSPPGRPHFEKIASLFRQDRKTWSFEPAIEAFFEGFGAALDVPTLGEALQAGSRRLDATLGVDVEYLTASRLMETDSYLAFVHHIAADIEQFSKAYNAALADYRRQEGIHSTTRPMPDLQIEPAMIELPFWLDDLETQQRSRAVVVRDGQHWALAAAGAFDFQATLPADEAASRLRKHLGDARLRLSPRALTLTMFLRLLLVDQFVHGIGGARYDQITDRIIHAYFGIDAPAFSVTTATLYFPNAGKQSSVCIPCLMTEGHRLRHNVTDTKQAHLSAITSAPRRSTERRSRYLAMHRDLAAAAAHAEAIPQWRQTLEQAIEREAQEQVLFDRELFYGIQTRERLTAMVDRYRIAFR